MASAPMKRLAKAGRFRLYHAERGQFVNPGLYVWSGKRHWLVLPYRWPRKVEEV